MPHVALGSATTYTYAQLEGLWIQAGGPRALAPVAAAIALAESGGDPSAINPNDNNGTQSSYGLWQISNGTHSPPSAAWKNPHENASLAVSKWKAAGQSFRPWGTFSSGAYKRFMSGRTTPETVPGDAGGGAASPAPAGSDCLIGLPGLLGGGCAVSKSEMRALLGGALMVAGAAVGLVGLVVLMSAALQKSGAAGKVADAAAVVPGGQVVAAGLHRAQQAPQRRQQKARQRAAQPRAKGKAP